MAQDKQDSFNTRRSTNIDGFFVKPASPMAGTHKPVFRAHTPKGAPSLKASEARQLMDMPRRNTPQNVLSSSDVRRLPSLQPSPITTEGVVANEQPRRRKMTVSATPDLSPEQKGARKHRKWKPALKRVGIGLGAVVLLFGAWFGWRFYHDISKLTGNKNPLALLSAFNPVPLKNQDGRVNILVAANSADDPGHNGANLTDSIMVISVDTKNDTALMLSIPRDLWVQNGNGYSKINALYPNGGMSALESTVEDVTGMPIHYNVLVSYDAFRDLVNAVGGITITIKSDDPRGIYDPNLDYSSRTCCALAKYPNGPVTLNGKQALDLARARGDPSPYGIPYGFADGDFTRTQNQREMLMAVKDKANQSSVIANPFKVADLVDAVGNNVKTNLQLDEIETLYFYMKKIGDNAIASYNINTLKGQNATMLQNYTAPDGESALIPAAGAGDYSDIKAQVKKVLSSDPITREGAVVEVLNGTAVNGLASKQQNALTAKGMDVTVGDAPATQATTTLIDNSEGKLPNTLAYLKKQYNAAVITSNTLTTTYPNADFILIIGQDQVPQGQGTTQGTTTPATQ